MNSSVSELASFVIDIVQSRDTVVLRSTNLKTHKERAYESIPRMRQLIY